MDLKNNLYGHIKFDPDGRLEKTWSFMTPKDIQPSDTTIITVLNSK